MAAGQRVAEARRTISFGQRAVAALEPGAGLRWDGRSGVLSSGTSLAGKMMTI